MGRLLWKEWHEIRWYFLGLVFGPWLISLWPGAHLGYGANSSDGDFVLILFLIVTFWGATRMPAEMRGSRWSMSCLPVGQWRMFAAKLLPGLIAAVLLPFWMRAVAEARAPHADYSHISTLVEQFWWAVCLYCTAFAVSMLSSTMVGVLASTFVVYGGADLVESYLWKPVGQVWMQQWTLAVLTFMMVFAAAGIWLYGRNAGTRRRWAAAGVSAVASLPLGFLAVALTILLLMSNQYYGHAGRHGQIKPGLRVVFSILKSYPERRHGLYDGAGGFTYLTPADGRYVAYSPSDRDPVCVSSRAGCIAVLGAKYASPEAWLPNGNLLVTLSQSGRSLDLTEWDYRSRHTRTLATFPNSPDNSYEPPIVAAIPRADGAKIAVFVLPRRGPGTDLWMLDRASRQLRLVRPGLDSDIGLNWERPAWDGDRLVFRRPYDSYCSIRSDGTGLTAVLR